jgi:hypothetical protein
VGELREQPIAAIGLETRVLEVGSEDAAEAVVFLHGHPGSAGAYASVRLPGIGLDLGLDSILKERYGRFRPAPLGGCRR